MNILRLPGYLWATPLTVLALFLLPLYGARSMKWSEGALDVRVSRLIPRWISGQTIGWVIFYATDRALRDQKLRAHERVHVDQCLLFGPLLVALYPLASAWAWVCGGHYYRDNCFESWARTAVNDFGETKT